MQKVRLKNYETWPEDFKEAVSSQGLDEELFNPDCEIVSVNARMEMSRSTYPRHISVLGGGFGLGVEPTGKWYFEFEICHRENGYSCLFVTELVTFERAKEIVRGIENAGTNQ